MKEAFQYKWDYESNVCNSI